MDILDQTEPLPKGKDTFGRIMRIAEWILLTLSVAGIALKLLHLPFASTFILFGIMGLGSLYFPIGILYAIVAKRFTQTSDKVLIVFSSLMLGTGCVGILFSIMLWPMSRTNIGTAAFMFVPLLIAALLAYLGKLKITKQAAKWVLVRLAVIAIPLWFFVFTSETQYYGMVGVLKDNPDYIELYRQCKEEGNREACQTVRLMHDEYRAEEMRKEIEAHTNR